MKHKTKYSFLAHGDFKVMAVLSNPLQGLGFYLSITPKQTLTLGRLDSNQDLEITSLPECLLTPYYSLITLNPGGTIEGTVVQQTQDPRMA